MVANYLWENLSRGTASLMDRFVQGHLCWCWGTNVGDMCITTFEDIFLLQNPESRKLETITKLKMSIKMIIISKIKIIIRMLIIIKIIIMSMITVCNAFSQALSKPWVF